MIKILHGSSSLAVDSLPISATFVQFYSTTIYKVSSLPAFPWTFDGSNMGSLLVLMGPTWFHSGVLQGTALQQIDASVSHGFASAHEYVIKATMNEENQLLIYCFLRGRERKGWSNWSTAVTDVDLFTP